MPAIVKCLVAVGVIAVAPLTEAFAQSSPLSSVSSGAFDERDTSSRRQRTEDATRVGDGPDRTIYMVLQTESTMTKPELEDKFATAQKDLPECFIGAVEIESINPSTYVLFKSIVQSGVLPSSPTSHDGVNVTALESEDGVWQVSLESSTKYLESATIKVGSPDEEISMKVEPKRNATANLRYYSPGTYLLRVPADRPVKSATFMVTDDANGRQPTPVPIEVDWQSLDLGRCYLVRLKDVEGDTSKFYARLRDADTIANPIKGLEHADAAQFVVASTTEILVQPLKFIGDTIELTFPKPGGKNKPKRMWMRFPLTDAEQEAVCKELDAKFSGDGFKVVPDWIRRNVVGDRLTPESSGWVELSWNEDHQAFERTLQIDIKAWQDRLINDRELMGQHSIVVYEFEGKDGSLRIMKLENGKYYLPGQMSTWLTELKRAPTAGY